MGKFKDQLDNACVDVWATNILEDSKVWLTQSKSYAVLSSDAWCPIALLSSEGAQLSGQHLDQGGLRVACGPAAHH